MASKALKELKNLSKEELGARLLKAESDLFQVKMQKATGQLQDTAKSWRIRKEVARIKTLNSGQTTKAKG